MSKYKDKDQYCYNCARRKPDGTCKYDYAPLDFNWCAAWKPSTKTKQLRKEVRV